jgi:hypothetical protein
MAIVVPAETNLFQDTTFTNVYQHKNVEQVLPIAGLNQDSALEFVIKGVPSYFIDLSETFLSLKVKLITSAGGDLTTGNVGVVNNFFHSIFRNLELYINNKKVYDAQNMYPYIAWMHKKLTYSAEELLKTGASFGWAEDTPAGVANTKTLEAGGSANVGLDERKSFLLKSREMTYFDNLVIPLSMQNRCLPPNVNVTIKLTPNDKNFYFKTEVLKSYVDEGNPKLQILEAILHTTRKRFSDALTKEIEYAHVNKHVMIPYKDYLIKAITLQANVLSYTTEALFQGVNPDTVIVALVDDAAYNGSLVKNPFYFENAGLTEVFLQSSSNRNYPPFEYKQKFSTNISKSYSSLLFELGFLNQKRESFPLSLEEWSTAHTIWAFHITHGPDDIIGPRSNSETGTLRLFLKFAAATTKPYKLIVLAEQMSKLELDPFNQPLTS